MTQIGLNLKDEDIHQADDYAGHGGAQGVAEEKTLVQGALHVDGSRMRSIPSRP